MAESFRSGGLLISMRYPDDRLLPPDVATGPGHRVIDYPGAAAQAGFRRVEGAIFAGEGSLPLSINAAVLQDTCSSGTIQADSRLYFLQDADWNTTAVVGYDPTSGTWNVVQRYVYDSYGNITILNADWSATPAGTAPVVNALYQGMQYDPITGMHYGRARWYSPSLGRWISQDQVGYVNGANAYQMEMGGPVDRLDPQGNSPVAVGDANLPPLGSAACQAAQDASWAGLGRAIHHAELTQEQEAGAIGCAGRGALTGGERGGAGAFHIVVLEVWDAVVGYLDTHPYPRCGPPRDILLPPFTGYGWGG